MNTLTKELESMPRVYLAGPEVFLPDSVGLGVRKKAICKEAGLTGVYPIDADFPIGLDEEVRGDSRTFRIHNAHFLKDF